MVLADGSALSPASTFFIARYFLGIGLLLLPEERTWLVTLLLSLSLHKIIQFQKNPASQPARWVKVSASVTFFLPFPPYPAPN